MSAALSDAMTDLTETLPERVRGLGSSQIAEVAEGVEKAPELDVLRQLGVDYAQGYYLARPLSLSDAVYRARED